MRHLLNDEQLMFADAVSRFVAQENGGSATGNPRTVDRDRLRRFAEMGGLSLAVPESLGGLGGPVEMMVVFEQLAAALLPDPHLASGVHAAALLARAEGASARALLTALTAGEAIVAIAHLEPGARRPATRPSSLARPDGDGFVLDGAKALVPFGGDADTLLVSATLEGEDTPAWFAVDRDTPGLLCRPALRIDRMPAADITLEHCRVAGSARLAFLDAAAAPAAADDIAEVAQVAEMVGLMDALVRATTDHVATRQQFGVPIGTFQALRHRIADMWMECEEARALAYAAALACAEDATVRGEAVSIAKVRASDAADKVGAEAIQIHGGIGMTDELVVSHWYRRLWALKLSIGDRRWHLSRLADKRRDFAIA